MLIEEEYLEISRGNISMMATILTFLGGFALASLLEIRQAFPDSKLFDFLVDLLTVISILSLTGALVGALTYTFCGTVHNLIRRTIQKRYEVVDMDKLLSDYSLFRIGKTITMLLTYTSLGLAVFFLVGLFTLMKDYVPILIVFVLLGVLLFMFFGRELLIRQYKKKKALQLNEAIIITKPKVRDYETSKIITKEEYRKLQGEQPSKENIEEKAQEKNDEVI